MEELPGGHAPGEADQVTRFTNETIAAQKARVGAWVFIALGVGCILFGGIFFAAMHSGHDVVATVTRVGPCSGDTCTVDVVYGTAGGQVSAVMYGVPSGEVYGPPRIGCSTSTTTPGMKPIPRLMTCQTASGLASGPLGSPSRGSEPGGFVGRRPRECSPRPQAGRPRALRILPLSHQRLPISPASAHRRAPGDAARGGLRTDRALSRSPNAFPAGVRLPSHSWPPSSLASSFRTIPGYGWRADTSWPWSPT